MSIEHTDILATPTYIDEALRKWFEEADFDAPIRIIEKNIGREQNSNNKKIAYAYLAFFYYEARGNLHNADSNIMRLFKLSPGIQLKDIQKIHPDFSNNITEDFGILHLVVYTFWQSEIFCYFFAICNVLFCKEILQTPKKWTFFKITKSVNYFWADMKDAKISVSIYLTICIKLKKKEKKPWRNGEKQKKSSMCTFKKCNTKGIASCPE